MHIFNQTAMWTVVSFIGWFFASYFYHGVGITLGYHRLLTHKSLQLPKWLSYLIVSGGYLTLMGSPVVWVAVHRLHHQKSDQEGDPHSPRQGFKHALYEWMFSMSDVQSQEDLIKQVPELMADPIYRSLGYEHEPRPALLCLAACIVFRIFLFLAFGWVALLANITASFFCFWSTQLVNAVCHLDGHGYRSHETREDSRNVWWVGILSLGEGWHNNHHAVPKSARHGMAWWEVDVTWYTIRFLEMLGLADSIVRPSKLVMASAANAGRQRQPNNVIPLEIKDELATENVFQRKTN